MLVLIVCICYLIDVWQKRPWPHIQFHCGCHFAGWKWIWRPCSWVWFELNYVNDHDWHQCNQWFQDFEWYNILSFYFSCIPLYLDATYYPVSCLWKKISIFCISTSLFLYFCLVLGIFIAIHVCPSFMPATVNCAQMATYFAQAVNVSISPTGAHVWNALTFYAGGSQLHSSSFCKHFNYSY